MFYYADIWLLAFIPNHFLYCDTVHISVVRVHYEILSLICGRTLSLNFENLYLMDIQLKFFNRRI